MGTPPGSTPRGATKIAATRSLNSDHRSIDDRVHDDVAGNIPIDDRDHSACVLVCDAKLALRLAGPTGVEARERRAPQNPVFQLRGCQHQDRSVSAHGGYLALDTSAPLAASVAVMRREKRGRNARGSVERMIHTRQGKDYGIGSATSAATCSFRVAHPMPRMREEREWTGHT